jgi:hypothetical protein
MVTDLDTEPSPQAVRDHRVETSKREIDEDIRTGEVPDTVASFSELADHVDANMYVNDSEREDRMVGPLGKRLGWGTEESTEFTSGIIEELDQWLANGRPSETDASKQPTPPSNESQTNEVQAEEEPAPPAEEAQDAQDEGTSEERVLTPEVEDPVTRANRAADAALGKAPRPARDAAYDAAIDQLLKDPNTDEALLRKVAKAATTRPAGRRSPSARRGRRGGWAARRPPPTSRPSSPDRRWPPSWVRRSRPRWATSPTWSAPPWPAR